VVVALRAQKGQGGEARDDRLRVPGTVEPLEELLIDQPSGPSSPSVSASSSGGQSGILERLGKLDWDPGYDYRPRRAIKS
jgi:hypothetical protein